MDDGMYPNDGGALDLSVAPAEQQREDREQQAKIGASYPILDDLISDFEQDIRDADSLTSVGITSDMPAVQVQIIMEGHKKYLALITTKLDVLKSMKEQFDSRSRTE